MLEKSLVGYKQSQLDQPFNLSTVPKEEKKEDVSEQQNGTVQEKTDISKEKKTEGLKKPVSTYTSLLSKIPQLAELGKPFKSSRAVQLTDSDFDYVVNCIKHVYEKNIVFQFNITNNVETQQLERVGVKMDLSGTEGLKEVIVFCEMIFWLF